MFSQEERCIYGRNQIMEVICQLRFPDILRIEAQGLAGASNSVLAGSKLRKQEQEEEDTE